MNKLHTLKEHDVTVVMLESIEGKEIPYKSDFVFGQYQNDKTIIAWFEGLEQHSGYKVSAIVR